jgi:putative flippase GtrA
LLSEWAQLRAGFDARLGPHKADLESAERLQTEVQDLVRRRDEDLAQIERETEQEHRYRERRDAFERADARFRRHSEANGNRQAVMTGRSPIYFLALACVGGTEWLINYTSFYLFFGVPAIAAGTTVILAILLAFASHGHGSILKQWTHRFGHHAERIRRIADWRLLILATLALLVVLGSAGGSRYMAALHVMRAQAGPNILGPDVVVQTDPTVDVLLSLLANLAAWLVGIFFAYVAHDIDPEFMDATWQRRTAWRRFHRLRRVADARIRQTEARHAKELRETEIAARSRMDSVAPQKALLDQIEAHDRAIRDAVLAAVRGNAERYRAALSERGAGGNALVIADPAHPPRALAVDRTLLQELES